MFFALEHIREFQEALTGFTGMSDRNGNAVPGNCNMLFNKKNEDNDD